MAIAIKEPPKTYEVRCPYCEALLEYTKPDIKYEDETYSRASKNNKYITCPACNNKITL